MPSQRRATNHGGGGGANAPRGGAAAVAGEERNSAVGETLFAMLCEASRGGGDCSRSRSRSSPTQLAHALLEWMGTSPAPESRDSLTWKAWAHHVLSFCEEEQPDARLLRAIQAACCAELVFTAHESEDADAELLTKVTRRRVALVLEGSKHLHHFTNELLRLKTTAENIQRERYNSGDLSRMQVRLLAPPRAL